TQLQQLDAQLMNNNLRALGALEQAETRRFLGVSTLLARQDAAAAADRRHRDDMEQRERMHTEGLQQSKSIAEVRLGLERRKVDLLEKEANFKPSEALLDELATQINMGANVSELTKGWGKQATNIVLEAQERAVKQNLQAGNGPGAAVVARRNLAANSNALRQLTKDETNFRTFLTTFELTVQNAQRLSEAVDRSGVPWANKAELQIKSMLEGDENAKNLIAQMEILARDADRVLSRGRGGGRGPPQKGGRRLPDPAMTHDQFNSLMRNVLSTDGMYAAMGFSEQRGRLEQAIKKGGLPAEEGRTLRVRLKRDPSQTGTL